MRHTSRLFILLVSSVAASRASILRAEDRVTYSDHVRPILASRCLNCHNPDKARAALDLSTYATTMTGGSSGKIVQAGNPDGSVLLGVITHKREPFMPLNSAPIPDAEIDIIRRWIAGGCLESLSSKPTAPPPAPTQSTPIAATPAKPNEKLIVRYPLANIVTSPRGGPVTDIALHPAHPLAAIVGQHQLLLYDIARTNLLGVLPFNPGFPQSLRFSRNGLVLIAAGGEGAKSGRVAVFSTTDGRLLASIGDESDAVRAADIDPAQSRIALGGPARVVKIYSITDNHLIQRLDKHTDWITCVAYSPDGVLLATADRGGNLHLWEADSLAPYLALPNHPAPITALDWRPDSNLLATACEDGHIRWFEINGGATIKEWNAHDGGCMSVRFTSDARTITAGRDRNIKLWDAAAAAVRTFGPLDDIALAAAFDIATHRIIGGDAGGTVRVFSADDGKPLGDLSTNPISYAEQLAAATAALDVATKSLSGAAEARKSAEANSAGALKVLAQAQLETAAADQTLASAENAAKIATTQLVASAAASSKASTSESPGLSATTAPATTQPLQIMLAQVDPAGRKSIDQQLATARATVDQARAKLTQSKADADSAQKVAAQAITAHESAIAAQTHASARLAMWQAGAVRADLDSADDALQKEEAQFAPIAQKAQSSAQAAQKAANELAAAKARLGSAPALLEQLLAESNAADARVKSLQQSLTEKNKIATDRAIRAADFAASVEQLKTANTPVSQPATSTAPSDPDPQATAAIAKATEALTLLQQSATTAAEAAQQVAAELKTAEAAIAASLSRAAAAADERAKLPDQIVQLESSLKAAEATAAADAATAQSARAPVDAAHQHVTDLKKKYDAALLPAGPSCTF